MSATAEAPILEKPAATAERPHPSTLTQWWVLTVRFIVPSLLDGELIVGIGGPVVMTVGIYVPFHKLWDQYVGAGIGLASSLGQYVAPLIVLQAVSIPALASAFRAATDALTGVYRRFAAMPIAPLTPVFARLSASVYRCTVGLVVSLICGYAIGFRFHTGPLYILAFCVLMMTYGIVLSFGADLIGFAAKNPNGMVPLLTAPAALLGVLSVGAMPLKLFPHWIQPIVRNNPVSQVIIALRALSGETGKAVIPVTWTVMEPTLAFLGGFALLLVPVSIIFAKRRRS
jgi:ABC-2 type transport system permease protein